MPDNTSVNLTRDLIRIPSANPGHTEKACALLLEPMLKQAGFDVSFFEASEDRTNLIARLPGDDPKSSPLCLCSHLDTVPLGETPWALDPFSAEIRGNKLYGRGSSDTKSSVAAMVVAAIRLSRLAGRRSGLLLLMAADEERANKGAKAMADAPGLLGKAGALVIGEPTSNRPCVGHKGVLWLEGETRGVAAHGSVPDQGENAIYKAMDAIQRIRDFDFGNARHPLMGRPTINLGTIQGGLNINSVPNRAVFRLDIRTVAGQSQRDVFDAMQRLAGGGVTFTRLTDTESVFTPPDNPWVQDVFGICERLSGARPEPECLMYFTDAAALLPALQHPPTLILGPGEAAQAHKTDEYCLVENIEKAENIYFEICKKWCIN